MEAGDPAAAEALLRQADGEEPGIGMIHYGIATALLMQRKPGDAADALRRLSVTYPEQLDVWQQLSQAEFSAQRFDQASQAAERTVSLGPASVNALVAARTVWLRTGEHDKILAALEAARVLNDRGEWACIEASVRVEEGDLDAARALLPRCQEAKHRPLVTEVTTKLSAHGRDHGSVAALAGDAGWDTSKAIAQAGEAVSAGDTGGAIALLDEVLKREAENGWAKVLRGIAHYVDGKGDKAREDLEGVFGAGTWIRQEAGGFSGITTKTAEERYRAVLREGSAILVLTDLDAGDQGHGGQAPEECTQGSRQRRGPRRGRGGDRPRRRRRQGVGRTGRGTTGRGQPCGAHGR